MRHSLLATGMGILLAGLVQAQPGTVPPAAPSPLKPMDLPEIVLRIEKGEGRHKLAPYMEAASAAGDDRATLWLANYYKLGYVPYSQDTVKASELAKRALPKVMALATAGDPEALCVMGRCYRDEVGVPRDLQKSFECCAKAAALGHLQAMGDLAELYMKGHGTPPDYDKARRFFMEAVEGGSYYAPRKSPSRKKVERDDAGRLKSLRSIPLIRVIGLSKKEGLALLAQEKVITGKPRMGHKQNDEILFFPEDGILMQVDIAGRITGVEAYRQGFHAFSAITFEKGDPGPSAQYQGLMPLGLSWTNLSSDTKTLLGSCDDQGDVEGDQAYGKAFMIDPVTLAVMFSYREPESLVIWRVFEQWAGTYPDEADFTRQLAERKEADDRQAWAAQFLRTRPGPDDFDKLIGLMTDPDYSVAAQAVAAIASLADPLSARSGHAALLVWNQRTKDQALRTVCTRDEHSGEVVARLAGLLAAFPLEKWEPALIDALDNPCPKGRADAAAALGRLRYPSSIDALIARKDDPNPAVRMAVLNVLNLFPEDRAQQVVLASQDHLDPATAAEAILIRMQKAGTVEKAPDPFLQGLKSGREDVRGYAFAKFAECGDPRYLPAVLEAFKREGGQHGLVNAGTCLLHFDDDQAWKRVGDLLMATEDSFVYCKLAEAVGQSKDPRRLNLARQLMEYPKMADYKRGQLVYGLNKGKEPLPVELFLPLVRNPETSLRQAVLAALSKSKDPRAAEAIRDFCRTEEGHTLQSALFRLKALPKGPENEAVLLEVLGRSTDPAVQKQVLAQLASYGSDARVHQAVEPLLENADMDVKKGALAIWRVSHPLLLSTEELEARVSDPNPVTAEDALTELLKKAEPAQAIAYGLKFLKTGKTARVRGASAEALKRHIQPEVAAALMEAGRTDPDAGVREMALRSAMITGQTNWDALADTMGQALKDPEFKVRMTAWMNLQMILLRAGGPDSTTPLALKVQGLMKEGRPQPPSPGSNDG